jgi:hypothetical protein
LDRTVFERVSRKCYLPANRIVLDLIDEFKREKKVKVAYSLSGFLDVLSLVDETSIEFHDERGDFERWAQHSLRDEGLETKFQGIRKLGLRGDELRKKVMQMTKRHLRKLQSINRRLGQY